MMASELLSLLAWLPWPNPHQERQFHAALGKHKELDEIAEIVKTKGLGAVVRYFYLVEGERPRARARVGLGGGVHRPRLACVRAGLGGASVSSRCNGLRAQVRRRSSSARRSARSRASRRSARATRPRLGPRTRMRQHPGATPRARRPEATPRARLQEIRWTCSRKT